MLDVLKNVSPTELILLIAILVILFGSKAIINLGKTGGETIRELKNIKKELTDAIKGDDVKGNSNNT
jgi:TatA/E family protein of Tat protein translocase